MPTRSILRTSRRLAAWLAALLLAASLAGLLPRALADPACGGPPAQRLYAVDAGSGHLAELGLCADGSGFMPAAEVDGADWRAYRDVFAATDGAATVVYAVTGDGQLWWRRQEAPGAPLGAPLRVRAEGDWDWSQSREVLASSPGVIQAVPLHGGPIVLRTFDQPGWATGDATVVEDEPLFLRFTGPSMTALHPGSFAEGNELGDHFRIWHRDELRDAWYFSGTLPSGVTGVAGAEPSLYGVNAAGHVVLLAQPPHPPLLGHAWDCPRQNTMSWQVAAESAGSYARVVIPVSGPAGSGPPSVALTPPGRNCPNHGPASVPVEWQ